MSDYEAIRAAAFNMPVADQLRLIDELATALPHDGQPTLSPEWMAEIQRRSAEIDRGEVVLEPWEEIRKRMFERAGLPVED
jgi:putative addiction module component (TIGR02574 family)